MLKIIEPSCTYRNGQFVCLGSVQDLYSDKFPKLKLSVGDSSKNIYIPFEPKQYFWHYEGFGLYLAVKPK